jgi:hypothetical protein
MIENLLPYLPELKTLIIKSLDFEKYDSYQKSKVCKNMLLDFFIANF